MEEKTEEVRENPDLIDLSVIFHDCFRGFRKLWWIAVILTVLGAGLGYWRGVRSYRPMYKCEASFTVMTANLNNANYAYQFHYDRSTASQMATTFPYILDSDLLTDLIKKDLGVDYINGNISAKVISNSNLFTLSVVSSDPEAAYAILNSVIDNYPEAARYVIGDTVLNMLDVPKVPQAPYNSSDSRHRAVTGAVKGLFLSMVIVVVYALTRKTIRREEEIKKRLNVPCLGVLPKVTFKQRREEIDRTISIYNDRISDTFRESVRSIAMRVQRQMDEKNQKILMVTGTVPGEGTTTVARNLAYALAEKGKRVLLFDADLRGEKESAFQGKSRPARKGGLEQLLLGRCGIEDVLVYHEKEKVWTLRCSRGMTPREILRGTGRLKELYSWMRDNMDYVIIDASPDSRMSQSTISSENADAALYVIEQDYAKINRIMEGIEDVSQYELTFLGCILNGTETGFAGYGYGKYGKYYGKYAYGKYGYGKYGYYGRYGKYGYGRYGYGYGSAESKSSAAEADSAGADEPAENFPGPAGEEPGAGALTGRKAGGPGKPQSSAKSGRNSGVK